MEGEQGGIDTVIEGDFNTRTGEEGGGIREEDWEEMGGGRRSKDRKINREGRLLLERIEKVGWEIFNGGTKGDEEGEWTYTGARGESE